MSVKKTGFITALGLALLCNASCSFLTENHDYIQKEIIPETFSENGKENTIKDEWWKQFDSPQLDSLITKALAQNLSLKEAWHRIEQANATAGKAGAELQPSVNLTGDAARRRDVMNTKVTGKSTPQRLRTTTKTYTLGLTTSYELDIWGRVRAARNAAKLDAEATAMDYQSTAISLAGQIAENWISLCQQRAKRKILLKQIKTNKEYLELIELRQRKGAGTALDVYQQKQILAKAEKQIPLVNLNEKKILNQLAILLGQTTPPELKEGCGKIPTLSATPHRGIPADLITNRPDIQKTLAELKSADWDIVAAKASRLPSISLTGTASFKADATGKSHTLFENWFSNLASSLSAPIWDGNTLRLEVTRSRAAAEEKLASYKLSILTAFKEVEDALVSEKYYKEYLKGQEAELEYSRKSFFEANDRYKRGQNDYLSVLQALTSVQELELNILDTKSQLISYRIELCKALGGTWIKNKKTIAEIKSGKSKTKKSTQEQKAK